MLCLTRVTRVVVRINLILLLSHPEYVLLQLAVYVCVCVCVDMCTLGFRLTCITRLISDPNAGVSPMGAQVCGDCTASCVDIFGDIDLAVVVDESVSVGAGLADALFSVRQGVVRLDNASNLNSVAVVRPTQPLGSRLALPFTTDVTHALDILQAMENVQYTWQPCDRPVLDEIACRHGLHHTQL